MAKARMIKTVNSLLLFASILIINGSTQLVLVHIEQAEEPEIIEVTESPREEEAPETRPEKYINPAIGEALQLRNSYNGIEVTYTVILTEYLGHYFITAYSDEETNSRATASGIEVHYSEDNFEPTTCAIDRSLFSFYEIIAVGDGEERKVYITEDTGSAVIGRHVDVYRETLVEVQNFPTSYQPVYYVRYVDHKITTKERRLIHELNNNYLHDRSFSGGFYCGPNRRAGD